MLKDKIKIVMQFPGELWLSFITHLPGPAGIILRYRYWRKKLRHLGRRVVLDVGVQFKGAEFIEIGDYSWIDKYAFIQGGLDQSNREKKSLSNESYQGAAGVVHIGKKCHIGAYAIISGISSGVFIGDECTFSAGCKIYAFSHHYRSFNHPDDPRIGFGSCLPEDQQCLLSGPVFIGTRVGLALNVIVLPGVSIPEGCFVAINSVVHPHEFTARTLLEGQPARKKKDRYPAQTETPKTSL